MSLVAVLSLIQLIAIKNVQKIMQWYPFLVLIFLWNIFLVFNYPLTNWFL